MATGTVSAIEVALACRCCSPSWSAASRSSARSRRCRSRSSRPTCTSPRPAARSSPPGSRMVAFVALAPRRWPALAAAVLVAGVGAAAAVAALVHKKALLDGAQHGPARRRSRASRGASDRASACSRRARLARVAELGRRCPPAAAPSADRGGRARRASPSRARRSRIRSAASTTSPTPKRPHGARRSRPHHLLEHLGERPVAVLERGRVASSARIRSTAAGPARVSPGGCSTAAAGLHRVRALALSRDDGRARHGRLLLLLGWLLLAVVGERSARARALGKRGRRCRRRVRHRVLRRRGVRLGLAAVRHRVVGVGLSRSRARALPSRHAPSGRSRGLAAAAPRASRFRGHRPAGRRALRGNPSCATARPRPSPTTRRAPGRRRSPRRRSSRGRRARTSSSGSAHEAEHRFAGRATGSDVAIDRSPQDWSLWVIASPDRRGAWPLRAANATSHEARRSIRRVDRSSVNVQ